jgi:hypothetical protein
MAGALLPVLLLTVHALCRLHAAQLQMTDVSVHLYTYCSTLQLVDKSRVDTEVTLNAGDFTTGAQDDEEMHAQMRALRQQISGEGDPTTAQSKYFEGDIHGITDIHAFVQQENMNTFSRNAIKTSSRRWPNAVVPYTLSNQYGQYARSVIASAMDEYHKHTCVRFVPRDESARMFITPSVIVNHVTSRS